MKATKTEELTQKTVQNTKSNPKYETHKEDSQIHKHSHFNLIHFTLPHLNNTLNPLNASGAPACFSAKISKSWMLLCVDISIRFESLE